MRGAFPNHPVASLRRVAAMYQNAPTEDITRVLQKMMDDEAFSSSDDDVASVNRYGCQMAIAGFSDGMLLNLRA